MQNSKTTSPSPPPVEAAVTFGSSEHSTDSTFGAIANGPNPLLSHEKPLPLSQFQAPDLPESDDPARRFVIDSDNIAMWALRRLASARESIGEITGMAQGEHGRIDAWFRQAVAKDKATETFFEGLLVDYLVREREFNGRKSILLPDGELKSSGPGRGSAEIDDAVFTGWAHHEGHEDLIAVTEKPRVAELRARFAQKDGCLVTADGEIVPGVRITPGSVSYQIRTNQKENQ